MPNVAPSDEHRCGAPGFTCFTVPEPSISGWRDGVGHQGEDGGRSRRDDPLDRYDVAVHGVLLAVVAVPCTPVPVAEPTPASESGAPAWHHRGVPPTPLSAAVAELAAARPRPGRASSSATGRRRPAAGCRSTAASATWPATSCTSSWPAGRRPSIHGRFVDALDGDVCAERVLATPERELRACGLSGSKTASLLDLADKVASGEVALDRIGRLSDDEVVAHLTVVRGIGPWTAQMFLMSALGRLDVWPVGDYGVRAGFARAWGLEELPIRRTCTASIVENYF